MSEKVSAVRLRESSITDWETSRIWQGPNFLSTKERLPLRESSVWYKSAQVSSIVLNHSRSRLYTHTGVFPANITHVNNLARHAKTDMRIVMFQLSSTNADPVARPCENRKCWKKPKSGSTTTHLPTPHPCKQASWSLRQRRITPTLDWSTKPLECRLTARCLCIIRAQRLCAKPPLNCSSCRSSGPGISRRSWIFLSEIRCAQYLQLLLSCFSYDTQALGRFQQLKASSSPSPSSASSPSSPTTPSSSSSTSSSSPSSSSLSPSPSPPSSPTSLS